MSTDFDRILYSELLELRVIFDVLSSIFKLADIFNLHLFHVTEKG
jgi:hypothetical protein